MPLIYSQAALERHYKYGNKSWPVQAAALEDDTLSG